MSRGFICQRTIKNRELWLPNTTKCLTRRDYWMLALASHTFTKDLTLKCKYFKSLRIILGSPSTQDDLSGRPTFLCHANTWSKPTSDFRNITDCFQIVKMFTCWPTTDLIMLNVCVTNVDSKLYCYLFFPGQS